MLGNSSMGRMLFEYPHDPRQSGGGHNTAAPLCLIVIQPEPRHQGAEGAQRLLLDSCIRDTSLRSIDGREIGRAQTTVSDTAGLSRGVDAVVRTQCD